MRIVAIAAHEKKSLDSRTIVLLYSNPGKDTKNILSAKGLISRLHNDLTKEAA